MQKKTLFLLMTALLLLCAACQTAPEAIPTPANTPAPASAPADSPAAEAATADAATPAPTAADADAESASRFQPLYERMLETGALPDMMALPADMAADFYGIQPEDCADGLYNLSYDSLLADEVVLVEAVDASAADRVEALLQARLAAKAEEADAYAPEQYAIIQGCRVLRDGLFVSMIVSPEFDALAALFEQGL